MAMTGDMLTIGQVADAAGLKTSAIRFYEARGLLPKPVRVGGQRRYTEQTLQRLAFLDVAKRAGFSLEEARLLFDAADQVLLPTRDCVSLPSRRSRMLRLSSNGLRR